MDIVWSAMVSHMSIVPFLRDEESEPTSGHTGLPRNGAVAVGSGSGQVSRQLGLLRILFLRR